jgi:PKD repeat protein
MAPLPRTLRLVLLLLGVLLLIAGCNLNSGETTTEPLPTLSDLLTQTAPPTRTPASTGGAPTALPGVTVPAQTFPTSVAVIPTAIRPPALPSPTPLPISIVILSPVPGNVIAGNVQIIGAATHPNFLQYQVEFGPDPNPGNLWYPATYAVQVPVINGLLGIWNTTTVQDGLYAVRLRVYLRDGTTLTTVVNNIRVQNNQPTPVPSATPSIPRPIAAFTQDRASGTVPLTVRFINQSSGQITGYNWNFGDNTSSVEVNPLHTYNTPGLYTVTLTVNGPGGSSNVSAQINVQSAGAPSAAFIASPNSGFAPLTVQFFDRSSGQINAYNWNFGDGTTSNQRDVSHVFNAVGTYNVSLTVSGSGGNSTVTQQIVVSIPIPTPSPIPASNTPVPPSSTPIPPTFTAIVVVPTNTPEPPTNTPEPPTATPTGVPTATPTNTPEPPTATVTDVPTNTPEPPTATATDLPTNTPEPPTATATDVPTSTPEPPTATATEAAPGASFTLAIPDPTNNPGTVQFSSTSTGTIASYAWDFGDGTTSTEQNPTHVYAQSGTYTVNLTVTGPGGSNSAIPQQVTVTYPPTALFQANVDPNNPLSVSFVDNSEGVVTSWAWDFGDGTTSTEQSPTHTYAAGGTYNVTLTATNAGGNSISTIPVTVTEPVVVVPPVAGFSYGALDPAQPLTIQFSDTSTGDYDTYAWDFGDGVQSNEPNPSHTYATGGTPTVTLTVTNSATGVSNVYQEVITVQAPSEPPSASFTASVPDPAQPLTVQFNDFSTGTFDSYQWDFGDGIGFSSDPNPIYTYSVGGTYPVTLTVTNSASGETSSFPLDVTVEAAEVPTTPSPAETTPIQPDIPALSQSLSNILSSGDSQSFVFALAGDGSLAQTSILDPFAPGGNNVVNDPTLQETVNIFNSTDLGGVTSFNRPSAAAQFNWRISNLLNPASAPPECGGVTPIECELNATNASVMFISIGVGDAAAGTNIDEFRANLEQIVTIVRNTGTIPVLMTIPPRLDGSVSAEVAAEYNAVIIEVADANDVPLLNLWRIMNDLPNSGLNADGNTTTAAPSGAGDLSDAAVSQYAENAINKAILDLLTQLRNNVLF